MNIDGVISIEMSDTFNFTHRMELKNLRHDVSKGIIVVTLQVVRENSVYKNMMKHKKMAQKESYLYRLDLPIELRKFGITERFFWTLHVTWEGLSDKKCMKSKTRSGICNKS